MYKRQPYDLEEVMALFEDDMELITLYHHIPTHIIEHILLPNPAIVESFCVFRV